MIVMLVDDHALFRDGLAMLLGSIDEAVQVLHAGSVAQALQLLAQEGPRPDLILLDMVMPGVSGLDALLRVRAKAEATPIVVLSGSEDGGLIHACIDAGAAGFILKSSDSRVMLAALRTVLAGGIYLPPTSLQTSVAPPAEGRPEATVAALTTRQREVLIKLAQGKPNKVIGRELGISDQTVKSHVSVLLQAFAARNRTEVVLAVRDIDLRLNDGPAVAK